MLEIFLITLPIFLLIGAGFAAAASRIMSRDNMQGVSIFVMYLALPSLMIRALTVSPLEEVFNPIYLLAYGLGSLVTFSIGLGISVGLRRRRLDTGAIHALGMTASNSVFIGYPVALMVIGPSAAIFMALNVVVEALIILPVTLILAEASRQGENGLKRVIRQCFVRLTRNPILIGLLIGVLLALTGLTLPSPLEKGIDMLADAAGPAALFTIGGMLYGLKLRGMAIDISQVVLGKLILHPLAVLGVFLLLPDPAPLLIAGALLFACIPMISIYPLFGQTYGEGETSAAALMISTLVSFVTISLMIWLLSLFELIPV